MEHFKVIKLLNSLATTKQLLNDMGEYDDYDMVELLEIKYEKLYIELAKH